MLKATKTALPGAVIVSVPAFADDRGVFKETYVQSKYADLGITDTFVQDNVSFSRRNVLRGLHADPKMAKLVQVLHGEVFDVMVDTRAGSPTFGQWEGVYLRAHEHTQLYIPAGFLHGFLALSDEVVFTYKQSAEYDPQREVGIRWDDKHLAIAWPLSGDPVISSKDLLNRAFDEVYS